MKSPTNNHRDNPGWELIIAPFAWLASKIVWQIFHDQWDKSPNIPYYDDPQEPEEVKDED